MQSKSELLIDFFFLLGSEMTGGGPQEGTNSVALMFNFETGVLTSCSQLSGAPDILIFWPLIQSCFKWFFVVFLKDFVEFLPTSPRGQKFTTRGWKQKRQFTLQIICFLVTLSQKQPKIGGFSTCFLSVDNSVISAFLAENKPCSQCLENTEGCVNAKRIQLPAFPLDFIDALRILLRSERQIQKIFSVLSVEGYSQ